MTVRNKLLQAGLMALLACGGTGSQAGNGSGGTSQDGGSAAPLTECDDPMPAWVFCSGFEEGSKAIWDDYDGNPDSENQLVADPGPWGVAGNHHLAADRREGGGAVSHEARRKERGPRRAARAPRAPTTRS